MRSHELPSAVRQYRVTYTTNAIHNEPQTETKSVIELAYDASDALVQAELRIKNEHTDKRDSQGKPFWYEIVSVEPLVVVFVMTEEANG